MKQKNIPKTTLNINLNVEHTKTGKIGKLKRISDQLGVEYYLVEYPDKTCDFKPADEFHNII